MKTKSSTLILAASLSLLSVLPASAAPASIPFGFKVSAVNLPDNSTIKRGDNLATVRALIGSPARQLAPHIWVYNGVYPSVESDFGCDQLVITFDGQKVKDLKVVNVSGVQAIAAHLKESSRATVQVARK